MKTLQISLNSIDKVKAFVNDITKFDCDFDLVSGRYVIDAKSIMGIFSLDISKPIDLNIHAESGVDEILASLPNGGYVCYAPTGAIRTFMFTFFIYSIIFNSLNTRSNTYTLFEHIGENKKFIIVMGSIAIVQSLLIQFGGQLFSTVPMDLTHFGLALLFAALIIPVDLIRKAIVNHNSH